MAQVQFAEFVQVADTVRQPPEGVEAQLQDLKFGKAAYVFWKLF
jgi:hypothetical protein